MYSSSARLLVFLIHFLTLELFALLVFFSKGSVQIKLAFSYHLLLN